MGKFCRIAMKMAWLCSFFATFKALCMIYANVASNAFTGTVICLSLLFQDFHDAIAGCDTKVQKAFAEMELLSNTAEGNMNIVLQNHVSRLGNPPVLLWAALDSTSTQVRKTRKTVR